MILEGKPLKGRELEKLKEFLTRMELSYDDGIEYSICILNEDYDIIGTGSVDSNVIKCVAIDPDYQGQGLSGTIMSNLIRYEFEKAITHFFLYTKPKNHDMFADMGFYSILQTKDVLLMENRSRGFSDFLRKIQEETPMEALTCQNTVGAIVANCNPFTLGHRYLIEEALKRCEYLHLFILSDNRSYFSADQRYDMVWEGVQDLDRVILHRTSDYMISAATFPTYFYKDRTVGEEANCKLDLEIFGSKIAPMLHITKRFVGTEPFCPVTRSYNKTMKQILPLYQIQVEEIERKELGEIPISASEVRKRFQESGDSQIKELVPEPVWNYLRKLSFYCHR